MKTYQIQLCVPAGFTTPWQADTIFGHLCWVAERNRCFSNFNGAEEFINLYRKGKPPLILSDGFPGSYLPAPADLLNFFNPGSIEDLTDDDYSALKKVKKTEYITLPQFLDYCHGRTFEVPLVHPKPLLSRVSLHNQISRITNTTGGEGGALFELNEMYLAHDAENLISIYARVEPGFEDDTMRLIELFSIGGFGKKRTSGKGAFNLEQFKLFDPFDIEKWDKGACNGFVSLSHFVPAKNDPTEGAYRILVKYGKLGDEKTFCGNPFKKPFIMLRPGAVFRTDQIKPFYGRLVENIAYADSSVVQYGFAFPVPIMAGK